MLLTIAAGFPNSEFERLWEAGALPMDIRLDWVRASGMRGAVFGSSVKLGWGSECVSMGFGRPPRTTEVARLRREGCSSFSAGGGGGRSLSFGRSAPDMRLGVLSRMFSNSLCCSRREMMLLMYNVKALFSALIDATSACRRLLSAMPSSLALSSSSARDDAPTMAEGEEGREPALMIEGGRNKPL